MIQAQSESPRAPLRSMRAGGPWWAALCLMLAAGAAHAQLDDPGRVWFGGYGRVGISADQHGGRGRVTQIVPFGPRLTEGNYVELDWGFHAYRGPDAKVKLVVTLGLEDDFFHYTGQWRSSISIRQAYVEAEELWGTGAFVWVGSKFFRGDDIYLLNFWPMDDLNNIGVGGGARWTDTTLHLHVGLNRLENGRQLQEVWVPANDFGAERVTLLDRQRAMTAGYAEHRWGGRDGAFGFKVKLYAEVHYLPSGERTLDDSFTAREPLPDDRGWMAGAQLGLWNLGDLRYLNLWLRYASGLAAYDELATPYGLNRDRRALDAEEYRVAFAGNWEPGPFLIPFGGYARFFFDADGQTRDFDDRQEAAFVVRPHYVWGIFTPAVEASVQASRPNGLNPRTQRQETATVTQLGVIPALTFADKPGTFDRPQIRLIYAVSWLNQAAMDLYAVDDPRATEAVVHFMGVNCEWWFGRGGLY